MAVMQLVIFYGFADVVLATKENKQYLCKQEYEFIINKYLESVKHNESIKDKKNTKVCHIDVVSENFNLKQRV